ncbi:peptidase S15 like protein [Zymoseptoria brevis]|uniref:Peptidase S15 like protein n=1 Tax=Zymoseptoria brevis TaxID=1047168 RepID=A0A0F4G8Q6_9PEZI|nr:peptidase S15 like protein [Zymoseptoria brevis]
MSLLRGWVVTPASFDGKLPCLVMAHGWTTLKEMDLNTFADYFISNLPISCLVYDNRGFGDSDQATGQPRHEIIPQLQQSDYSDAITYASSLPEVDPDCIGIWGSSYSGGHVLHVGAVDRRVKAVLSQVLLANGWENFNRLIRPDFSGGVNASFAEDRPGRLQGKEPALIPVVDVNPTKPSSLPINYKRGLTSDPSVELLRSNDPSHMVSRISPTPLLITIAQNDVLTPTDIVIETYSRAREPKQINIIPGGHFDGYSGPNFERNAVTQAQFLKTHLFS